jgi:hypothetical protein
MAEYPSARDFAIDEVRWGRHLLSFVSMDDFHQYGASIAVCPPDRLERISGIMDRADLTVVPYFTPELQANVYSVPLIGGLLRSINFISPDYFSIAEMGHSMGSRMGVADVANRFLYYPMELATFAVEAPLGGLRVTPTRAERTFPTAVDARRIITAEAIAQEAGRHPEGVHITYIAAPAHVNRVSHYITEGETWFDSLRSESYRYLFPGLDMRLRVYVPEGENWQLEESHGVAHRPLGGLAVPQLVR